MNMLKEYDIKGIDVFLEKYKSRTYVGRLDKKENRWRFCYDESYLNAGNSISFSVELPLTQRCFFSDDLFDCFYDRLPSRENAAYPEYCESVGIDVHEKDLFVLLAALGARGPSSFILTPVYSEERLLKKLRGYRRELGMTVREFCRVFEFSAATLRKFEKGQRTSRDAVIRIKTYYFFPQAALLQLNERSKYLHRDKYLKVREIIR